LKFFAPLEDRSDGAGVRFLDKLDFTLGNLRKHPELAPIFEGPVRRLVIGSTAYGLVYSVEARASWYMR
jgi:hypothetical protein